MTDPNNPVEIAQGNTTLLAPANANGNGTGQVKFGETTYRKAVIYALDTNNGIQAFELTTVPEPSCLALAGLCCCLVGPPPASTPRLIKLGIEITQPP